jgi:hypothetical protein
MPEQSARPEGPEGRGCVRYHVVVRGEIDASLVGPLEGMVVERGGAEPTMGIDIVDQSHLQGVLRALHERGIAIVRFHPASDTRGRG